MSYHLSDFQTDVLDRSRSTPVLVDFWAARCGPCKMFGPVLEKLAAEAAGRWTLVKIDTEAHPELAAQFQIGGLPNCKLFHHGAVVAGFAGALPESQLRAWLAANLPTPKRETMTRARELLRAGHSAAAAALLRPLADAHPADAELAVLAARALVFSDPTEAARRLEALPPASPWNDEAGPIRTVAQAFAGASRAPERLAATPLRARYLAALAEFSASPAMPASPPSSTCCKRNLDTTTARPAPWATRSSAISVRATPSRKNSPAPAAWR
jgi:putative thioredoxin